MVSVFYSLHHHSEFTLRLTVPLAGFVMGLTPTEFVRHDGRTTKQKPPALTAAGGFQKNLGGGLLSHDLDRSIIGDGELNYRVRNGFGCTLSSMTTKKSGVRVIRKIPACGQLEYSWEGRSFKSSSLTGY